MTVLVRLVRGAVPLAVLAAAAMLVLGQYSLVTAALAGFAALVLLIACHARGRSDLSGLTAPLLGACAATVAVAAAVLLPPGPAWLAVLVPVLLAGAFAVARLPGSH